MAMQNTAVSVYADADGTETISFEEVEAAFMAGRKIIVSNGTLGIEETVTGVVPPEEVIVAPFSLSQNIFYVCATA